ncbi:cysteine hydrolase [Sphingobium sp. SCG-1]|uniref:cysteine hydrolase family protein n=1 Tax=Sphingobium sp. SCG-1 TaxID=2072936 RepID=UPI000CD6AE5E|nr:cysteine hydrolase family protein [Sphingobium sp. SCG-1]AUW57150.1 cysteine hydrolase [Sphingobium sp. SCG-1]
MIVQLKGLDDGEKPALLVVECQNRMTNPDYADPNRKGLMEQVVSREIIGKINILADAFRAAGHPVIFATIVLRSGFEGFRVNCRLSAQLVENGQLVDGNPAARLNDHLRIRRSDIVANRRHGMAIFTGTDMDATLRGFGVDTVVLAGVSTNIALPSSTAEAIGLGYNVVLAEDCSAGGSAETHEMQITKHLPFLATIASSRDIMAAIGQ